jgi:allantoinase
MSPNRFDNSTSPDQKRRMQERFSKLSIQPISTTLEAEQKPPGEALSATYTAACPDLVEINGVKSLRSALEKVGDARVLISNLSSSSVFSLVDEIRDKGFHLKVETTSPYLFFTSQEIAVGDTRFKTYPPIRSAANCNMLWETLKQGQIDMISSNHNPISPEFKFLEERNFRKACSGASTLGYTLSAVWSKLKTPIVTKGTQYNTTISKIFRWLATNPAEFLALNRGKI